MTEMFQRKEKQTGASKNVIRLTTAWYICYLSCRHSKPRINYANKWKKTTEITMTRLRHVTNIRVTCRKADDLAEADDHFLQDPIGERLKRRAILEQSGHMTTNARPQALLDLIRVLVVEQSPNAAYEHVQELSVVVLNRS